MKGKYGTRAAIRKEASEVEASEAAYRRQIVRLTEERDRARAERDEARIQWKQEVRVLKAHVAEGTSARVEALTRELEFSRSAVRFFAAKTEFLVYNACRYLSMTLGRPPHQIISFVLAWATGRQMSNLHVGDVRGLVVEVGATDGGWVDLTIQKWTSRARKQWGREDVAIPLDEAERDGHPDIHPNYRPEWYSGAVPVNPSPRSPRGRREPETYQKVTMRDVSRKGTLR